MTTQTTDPTTTEPTSETPRPRPPRTAATPATPGRTSDPAVRPDQGRQPEPTTGTDPAQQPAESPQDAAQHDAPTEGGNAEAARYRVKLRAAEGERDGLRTELDNLRGRLEQVQRREVLRLTADLLAQPGDLLEYGGVSLTALVDDEGAVDEQAVLEATAAMLDARPGLSKTAPRPTAPPNHGAGYRGPTTAAPPSWGDVFRG